MGYPLNYTAGVEIFACYKCGAPIALANVVGLRRSHQTWYCPNGHGQIFSDESDEERAKRLQVQLDAEKARSALAEKNADVLRTKLADTEHRVRNGVCPFCRRSFTNVRRHMASKHKACKAKGKKS